MPPLLSWSFPMSFSRSVPSLPSYWGIYYQSLWRSLSISLLTSATRDLLLSSLVSLGHYLNLSYGLSFRLLCFWSRQISSDLIPILSSWFDQVMPFPILISCRAADLIKWSGRVELYPNLFVIGMMNDDMQSRLQQIYVTFMQYQKGIFHCHNGIMLKMICQWCFCMESSTIDEHLCEYNSLVGTRMFCISTAAVIVWRKW